MSNFQNPWGKGGKYWPGWDGNQQGSNSLSGNPNKPTPESNINNVKFNSREEFLDFVQNKKFEVSSSVFKNGDILKSQFKFYVPILQISVNVFIKVDPSDKITPIKEVFSTISGFTLIAGWTQDTFDVILNGGEATIYVYGTINYNLFLEGIGTIYKEKTTLEMKIDVATGKELSGKVIE